MKLIFIDVDGTLLDYESNLPDSASQAIRETRKKGNLVYICTGRSEAEVYDYIWEIGLDGMIGGNGSYVKDGDEVLLDQHISAEDERKIVDWLRQETWNSTWNPITVSLPQNTLTMKTGIVSSGNTL